MAKGNEKFVEDSSRATLGETTGEGIEEPYVADTERDRCQVREVRVYVKRKEDVPKFRHTLLLAAMAR